MYKTQGSDDEESVQVLQEPAQETLWLYNKPSRYSQGVRVWLPKTADGVEIERKLPYGSLISDRGFLTYLFWKAPRGVLPESLMT